MKLERLINKIIPPCHKCPYKLGHVKFVIDPCPRCKVDNYSMYYQLTQRRFKPPDTHNRVDS